jgi:hypothetical protein
MVKQLIMTKDCEVFIQSKILSKIVMESVVMGEGVLSFIGTGTLARGHITETKSFSCNVRTIP